MNIELDYKHILLRNKKSIVNSRSDCKISTYFGSKEYSTPVCCSNMKSIITFNICKIFDSRKWFYVYHRIDGCQDVSNFVFRTNEEGWYSTSISVGIGEEWVIMLKTLSEIGKRIDSITVDVAHSFNDNVIPIIKAIREYYPNAFLIVGNGSTREWVEYMENLGVDCIKMGIGVSKACRTRQYTGFGSSTVTSLIECVEAVKNAKIMTDGGLTVENGEVYIGDINKSLVLGADYIMTGSSFSKCINSPAIINGYYGNASQAAKGNNKNIEGTTVKISTNGMSIDQMCDLIEDSIQSGISYAGGNDLTAFKTVEYAITK